jgi:hypothetical protein
VSWQRALACVTGSARLADAAAQFKADHRPGVLAAWSWAHLSEAFGGSDKSGGGGTGRNVIRQADAPPVPKWPCLLAAPGRDRFIPCDTEKNIFGSFYHIRVRRLIEAATEQSGL